MHVRMRVHTHTHTHAHARTHARTHAHAHTHTHTHTRVQRTKWIVYPCKLNCALHIFMFYKVAYVCFNAINGSGPAYLSGLLHVCIPSRTLRSSSATHMLKIQQYKRKTHGFRTVSYFGPHILNSLPQDLRHCSTLSSFQAKLKTFLFSQYFHPS